MNTTTLLVWYFLAHKGGAGVSVAGPFANEQQCKDMARWAYQYVYTSDCYAAPWAAPQPYIEQCNAKSGCK